MYFYFVHLNYKAFDWFFKYWNNAETFLCGFWSLTAFWFTLKLFYDIEKNGTRLLQELKCDSSEIRAVRRVNEETYIMSQNKVLEFFSQTFVPFYENSRYKLDLNVTEIKLLNYCNNVFAKILYCFHTFSMT